MMVSRRVDQGDHGLGLAEPDVVSDVHRPVVVEERDEVVGVAGGGGDGSVPPDVGGNRLL